jgi:hypothetical protein
MDGNLESDPPGEAQAVKIRELLNRFRMIVVQIQYKHWKIAVDERHNVPFLRVEFWAPSTKTDEFELQIGRPWMLSEEMTDAQVVQTALMAVLAAEEHEAREQFTYLGRPIFGPHPSLDVLASATLLKPEFGIPGSNPILDLM